MPSYNVISGILEFQTMFTNGPIRACMRVFSSSLIYSITASIIRFRWMGLHEKEIKTQPHTLRVSVCVEPQKKGHKNNINYMEFIVMTEIFHNMEHVTRFVVFLVRCALKIDWFASNAFSISLIHSNFYRRQFAEEKKNPSHFAEKREKLTSSNQNLLICWTYTRRSYHAILSVNSWNDKNTNGIIYRFFSANGRCVGVIFRL